MNGEWNVHLEKFGKLIWKTSINTRKRIGKTKVCTPYKGRSLGTIARDRS